MIRKLRQKRASREKPTEDELDWLDAIDEDDAPSELVAEVQGLAWALLDRDLDDTGQERLETLLAESDEARRAFVHCIQLHADLMDLFAREKDDDQHSPSPLSLPAELREAFPTTTREQV